MKFADGHSDFLSAALDRKDWKDLKSSPEKLRDGKVVFQVYAVYVGTDHEATKRALRQVELFWRLDVKRVLSPDDLPEDPKELHVMLALEGLLPIDGYPELLGVFHRLGVRMASLVWSRVNSFADGSKFEGKPGGRGISDLGKEALRIMEELGWILDVSHLNDRGAWDVFESFGGKIVATHSSSRVLCDTPRNIPDDIAREIARRGGVVGVNFSPRFLKCSDDASIDDVIDHVEHFLKVLGEDHVALGSDFDGLRSYPKGLEDASKLPNLWEKMVKRLGEDVAEKVAWKNWIRVVKS